MVTRTTLLLFAFLIILAFALYFVRSGASTPASMQSVFDESMIQNVDQLILKTPDASQSLAFERDDDDWLVNGHLADHSQVENFLQQVVKLPKGQLVSKNPDNWPVYGLDAENLHQLVLSSDTQEFTVTFGNPVPRTAQVYVRYDEQPEVRMISTSLLSAFRSDLSRWREKQLLPDDQEYQQLSVRLGDERWVFTRSDNVWTWKDGEQSQEIPSEDMNRYLDRLQTLKATGFETDVERFQSADNALSLVNVEGEEIVLSVDALEDGAALARTSGTGDELYQLSSDLNTQLRPDFLEK